MVKLFFRNTNKNCTIFEIYPESETPNLTQIAHINLHPPNKVHRVCLLPGMVIWHSIYKDRIVFRVWDYQLNHSISFSVNVDADKFHFDLKVYFILSKALKLASNSFVGR